MEVLLWEEDVDWVGLLQPACWAAATVARMMMCWFEDEDGVDGEGEEEGGLAVLAVPG
jgi:hypothetical protein